MARKLVLAITLLGAALAVGLVSAQSTVLYQAVIYRSGSPFSGSCDIAMSGYDALTSGTLTSAPLTTTLTITNGVVALPVTFAAGTTHARVDLQCTGDSGYTTLTPRVALADLAWPASVSGAYTVYSGYWQLATTSESESVILSSGNTATVVHSFTYGEMVIGGLLAMLIAVQILFWAYEYTRRWMR